ncbi:hypothetical protein HJC23_007844 [Cyclotella cryptica]|uniref:Arf-GAP domain-containing protein n=1 Tax=Cyclotella cryptica TaxID=29204 RepID=A0ABD3R0G1_9STRA|eukprot:CCRYP_000174-RA/>CCRYP_000174-RA protein AED:0.00 eAED:0.00 QI:76/-1/1/1/-1/1/1/115/532
MTTSPLTPSQQSQLLSLPGNSVCAECSTPNTSWSSLTYGITLCLDCAGLHRGLGVHLSFVRSLTMDDWSEAQFQQMMRGGNERWNQAWKEGDATLEFRERQFWKAVKEGTMERNDMVAHVRSKYESDVARRYRDMLALKAGTNTTSYGDGDTCSSAVSPQPNHVVSLPVEEPPTIQQAYQETWPFALALVTTNSKNLTSLLMWVICGFGLASWVNKHGPLSYAKWLVPGIIGATAFVPYYFISKMASGFAAGWVNHRQEAFKSARNLLVELISNNRAKRLSTCDVYYPKCGPNATDEKKARAGLIFYPGALVDRTAYAPIASKLAEAGVFVVVANMEPFRVVISLKSYNLKEKVMRMISDALLLGAEDGGGLWQVDEWAIGGHSMGGHLAIAACANEMSSTLKKVVLWGVGSYPTPSMYPSKVLKDSTSDVDVLLINGSNDTIVKNSYSGKNAMELLEAKLPPRAGSDSVSGKGCTFYITIEGGNHSGCAHYGPQTYPRRDADRTITLEEQQIQTAKFTADFLLGNYSKLHS